MAIPSTISIDGPAASGKSTIAQRLAARLDYLYLDTGVMYRAVTLAAQRQNIPIDDENAISALAERLQIDVLPPTASDGRAFTVLADGEDVTWAIRSTAVEAHVSPVSAYRRVRTVLTEQMRRIGARGRVVMVGRDIGTVVLPNANLKVYLDASVEERARRRFLECQARGLPDTYDDILSAMRRRDEIDSSRAIAPLKPADDARVVDTTTLNVAEVLAQVERLVFDRG